MQQNLPTSKALYSNWRDMQSDKTEERAQLRGYLTIHVAGYKMHMSQAGRIIAHEGEMIFVPDRLIKAELHDVGSTSWIEEGWAVGDNPKERFCKWGWIKPMLKFHDFDEAVAYVYRLRQKRKAKREVYTLVCFLKDHQGRENFKPVYSIEDIARYENEVDNETAIYNEALKAARQANDEEYPSLDLIVSSCGVSSVIGLSTLLKAIRNEGEEKGLFAFEVGN